MYSNVQFKPLLKYLTNHKYNNLHTRRAKQVNNNRVLKHLHGMKLINKSTISGYFCGQLKKYSTALLEIEYEIDNTGTVLIKARTGLNEPQALQYIDDEINAVMKRVNEPVSNFTPKYKKNNFYLRRRKDTDLTPAASKTITNGVLTSKFVNTMASWNLSVIEGRN